MNDLPGHVAIIMDGNGRWAQRRNLPRTRGHIEGVKRVEEIVESARILGIKVLTLYTFSTENWTRPRNEVSMLMRTLLSVLQSKVRKLSKVGVKIKFIGRREGIPSAVLQGIQKAETLTARNKGLILNLAFNYGSRLEMLDAVKKIANAVRVDKIKIGDIDEKLFSNALYTDGLPDPDLLIRTSGEKRISNFLLWQLSYSELYFTETCWPDFNRSEFERALEDYKARERRYGNIASVRN